MTKCRDVQRLQKLARGLQYGLATGRPCQPLTSSLTLLTGTLAIPSLVSERVNNPTLSFPMLMGGGIEGSDNHCMTYRHRPGFGPTIHGWEPR